MQKGEGNMVRVLQEKIDLTSAQGVLEQGN